MASHSGLLQGTKGTPFLLRDHTWGGGGYGRYVKDRIGWGWLPKGPPGTCGESSYKSHLSLILIVCHG